MNNLKAQKCLEEFLKIFWWKEEGIESRSAGVLLCELKEKNGRMKI